MPRTARRNIEAAVLAVDPRHRDQYRNRFAAGDFVGAMKAVFELPRPLGTLAFPRDSAVPTSPTALQDVKSRLLAAFPDPALTVVTYFSLAGDVAAGTPEIRDTRRAAVRVATTTAEGNAPRPAAATSSPRGSTDSTCSPTWPAPRPASSTPRAARSPTTRRPRRSSTRSSPRSVSPTASSAPPLSATSAPAPGPRPVSTVSSTAPAAAPPSTTSPKASPWAPPAPR